MIKEYYAVNFIYGKGVIPLQFDGDYWVDPRSDDLEDWYDLAVDDVGGKPVAKGIYKRWMKIFDDEKDAELFLMGVKAHRKYMKDLLNG